MHLIVDSYSTHQSATSIHKAKHNFFFFILSGYINLLQSFYIAVFTPSKSMTNSTLRQYLFTNKTNKVGKINAVLLLVEEWQKLSKEIIIKGYG